MPTPPPSGFHSRFLAMFALVFGGEMISSLPYHVPRYYRPTGLGGLGNGDLA